MTDLCEANNVRVRLSARQFWSNPNLESSVYL